MSRSDGWVPGDWNAVCFICGSKMKASQLKKHWKGYYTCEKDWEPRHPQDFVRAAPDNTSIPWSQPEVWAYVGPPAIGNSCTITGLLPQADLGSADCAIVSI